MLSACLARPSAAAVGLGLAAARRSLARPPSLAQRRQQQRRLSSAGSRSPAATEAAEAAAAVAALAAASSSSGSSSSSSSGDEAAPPTPAQAAAAERLLQASREVSQRRSHTRSTDEELRQRIVLLLQLGLAEVAIQRHIEQKSGGPYVAWGTVAELVVLLQREGFSQQQLDELLVSGGSTGGTPLVRAPADVAANLRWLRETFGLSQKDAARGCSRASNLLVYSVETLQDNWAAIVNRRQLPDSAIVGAAAALRGGKAEFLLLTQEKVSEKERDLQALLGLTDAQVAARYNKLAALFGRDIAGLAPRVQLLRELTGLPLRKLAPRILVCTGLLTTPEPTLRRNYDAILAAVGSDANGKLLISRRPDVLAGAVDRVERNLRVLREPPFGCSPEAAVKVLLSNPTLAGHDLERPAFAARVAFWQQAYECATAEAALLKCASMLHCNLRTVASRAAYWREQHPGRELLSHPTFSASDATFCSKRGFQLAAFQAWKQRWLASEEGRAVCRHERGGGAAGGSE